MKLILFSFIIFFTSLGSSRAQARNFTIDYDNDVFSMDGVPFRYVAGSFHYFRAHEDTWQDKLRKMRMAGLNAVDIYVQWSLHNPKDGIYNWEGIANVERFIELATSEDLYIILRPGPYICAEIDNGGLPYWLATKYPDIKVRTNDSNYLREVRKWYEVLMPKFQQHWYANGGNIIMVQIENEYGAYKVCDDEYKVFLRDLTLEFTGDGVVLFTTDRPIDDELSCGYVENVFVTTDFGIANETEVEFNFNKLRSVQPKGPLVNSEFYTGWLTHWQEKNARRSSVDLDATLNIMLANHNANVNFYMFFGGTNFGFWAGANDWGIGRYMADITSYDYDAPLSEPGDLTPKYYVLRSTIGNYLPLPPLTLPGPSTKTKYQTINVKPVNHIFSNIGREILGSIPVQSEAKLLTFEELDQFSGFVLYETTLPSRHPINFVGDILKESVFSRDPANLVVEKLRDRALIYVDNKFVGALSRENMVKSLPLHRGHAGKKLQIFVENQGRINFQENFDLKGILGNVTIQTFLDPHYEELSQWTITGYPFDDYSKIERFINTNGQNYQLPRNGWLKDGPVIFEETLNIPDDNEIADSWWNVRGWGKGFFFVNGYNLGRYWSVGPQMTMYIPKEILKHGENPFVIVELQKAPLSLEINFSDVADFNED